MSLPAHRRIQQGRTHASAWDSLSYACAVQRSNPTTRRMLDAALNVGLAISIGIAGAVLLAWSI